MYGKLQIFFTYNQEEHYFGVCNCKMFTRIINCADPDQSYLGLHCLSVRNSRIQTIYLNLHQGRLAESG